MASISTAPTTTTSNTLTSEVSNSSKAKFEKEQAAFLKNLEKCPTTTKASFPLWQRELPYFSYDRLMDERRRWTDFLALVEDDSITKVQCDRCSQMVPDQYKSSRYNVCMFCDLDYQCAVANPAHRLYCKQYAPFAEPILYD